MSSKWNKLGEKYFNPKGEENGKNAARSFPVFAIVFHR